MNAAVIFDNFGPYHLARLRASARVCRLTAMQVCSRSAEYAWENNTRADNFKSVTLFPEGTNRDLRWRELKAKMDVALDSVRPQVVFIPGWSGCAAFAALHWCLRHKIPAVAMSESTEWDEKRIAWKEWMKRRLMGLFSAALAGGNPQKNYLMKLGMPTDRIFLGYDAVDNEYFAQGAKESRSQNTSSGFRPPSPQRGEGSLPENYFLASARFIEKKNLSHLLQAYARYRELAKRPTLDPRPSTVYDLVLLGDGALRETLNSQLSTLNLQSFVQMPGFKQYPDLPVYYGCARAFIHASTTEQWGLVVNEAMASGLPVLVSNRCGCAPDLVQEGVNGFTFDPSNVEQLAQLMLKLSTLNPSQLSTMGAASARIIAEWGPERFASGLKAAVDKALEIGPRHAGIADHLLLQSLLAR